MRALVLALASLCALAAPAAVKAQETPPEAAGPFLLLQETDDVLVLASLAERRRTPLGASATTVAFLQVDGALLRGESVTEADCGRGLRRTLTIFVQEATDPDVRVAPFVTAPGIDWSAPGPLDGPLMDFLCQDGRHAPAQVSPRPSTFVTPWLEGR